jgi:hypothetical protein
MVTYAIRCTEQSAHDCFKTVEVEIGVPGLTPEQLARIFEGRQASAREVTAELLPDTTHFIDVELDAAVCSACLKDRSTEIPD